ncbi:VOC family protein [Antrihabitans cavernicola]|uniref:VOC family protein n=1 Tax=Antrihabitans cavernicola TaxID=2495913 RepID=A0A5A7S6A3_9NOCA|nr:VOC family protein [Spelaeibacter cavernicola]KAA0021426.1 VOC family protein [Spelaeibacter cavernicola]
MTFAIDRIDHVVINCRDVEATAQWYSSVLGMSVERFGPHRRVALKFGLQKINLRPTGADNWHTAEVDSPGSEDLCFVTTDPIADVVDHFARLGVIVVDGPVEKIGALGLMTSVYCRDIDGNLVEVARYPDSDENMRNGHVSGAGPDSR